MPAEGRERLELGREAEELAAEFLRRNGYTVVERNYDVLINGKKVGELDIICDNGTELLFVEVRSATGTYLESPALTVETRKQAQIVKTARFFIHERSLQNRFVRFDVVGITFSSQRPHVEWFKDAFRPPSTGQSRSFW